jgi:hypothetical protein
LDLTSLPFFVPSFPQFKVDEDKFWKWWDTVNIPIGRIQKDSRGHSGGYNGEFWDGVTIWQKDEYQKSIVWKVNYVPNDELFESLINNIINLLPWFDIQGITIWSNKTSIPPHKDGLPRDPFPSAPRILLFDNAENRTFYLFDKSKTKFIFPDLRTGPNLMFFNNENFDHGATTPKNGRKALIRIDGPLIDRSGFLEFINIELNKGQQHEF